MKMTLKGGYVPLKKDNIHSFNQEISRGVGVQKSKKGKGSYTRKEKHKNKGYDM